jgi:2-polyprenyl-6-methoxyphenol hydroxylase-like FAD-dependent oxidoreductase
MSRTLALVAGLALGAEQPPRLSAAIAATSRRRPSSTSWPAEGEAPAMAQALIHHGIGYADGVMPLGEGAYFYDSVPTDNRAAVEARGLDGWRAVYAARVPYAAELTAGLASWEELSVFGTRPGRAARRVADGAALRRDAAAAVHPHSAQGANLALEDGVALGELLARLDPTRELRGSDLAPYRREGGRKAARYVAWSRLAGWTFDGATALARANRWAGWQSMRLPLARRTMLRQGAGLM